MPDTVTFTVDGEPMTAVAGMTLAAALLGAGRTALRRSVSGEPRGALCGMGICFECRVTIDGLRDRRACLELVRQGMQVETDA